MMLSGLFIAALLGFCHGANYYGQRAMWDLLSGQFILEVDAEDSPLRGRDINVVTTGKFAEREPLK